MVPTTSGGEGDQLSQRLTRSLASPFGVWSTPENRTAAITMLSVYGAIFLAGLIGHVCVTAYTAASRKKYHNCRRGALLILANLSSSQMVFLLCCLPSIAYKSIMSLSFRPWFLSDIVCRMIPFIELFILGVTVLSFCALSIDRFRSAGQNTKAYEEAGDSCLTGICKLIIIWVGAMILASPELFVFGTSTYQEQIPQKMFQKITKKDPAILEGALPQYKRLEAPEENRKDLMEFLENFGPKFTFVDEDFTAPNVTFAVTYQFQKCEAQVALWPDAPAFVATFVEIYINIRLWWLFGFYFCLPVFFSLLFAMLVALRLSRAHDKCLKEYGQYPVDGAVGTLNSHRGGSLNRSNSVASNQTLSSGEVQQLIAAQNGSQGTPLTGSLRHNQPITPHRSTSPANSYPGGFMTPMIVRACNTPLSPAEHGSGYLHSPITSPSVTSHMNDDNGQGKTSSLPPHGRGSRVRGRMQKNILFNIARDRALNTVLVALILAFSLTWLPQHIFHILFAKTQLEDALETRYVVLVLDICRYMSAFSFAVNPIVIYLAYKPYRMFLDRFCCPCKCCSKC